MARIQLVQSFKLGIKMITFFKNRLNRIAIRITLLSFVLGHFVFLGFLAYPEDFFLGLGITFFVLFIAINVLTMTTLCLNALIHFKDYEENLTALILVFANVSLALFYLTLIS